MKLKVVENTGFEAGDLMRRQISRLSINSLVVMAARVGWALGETN